MAQILIVEDKASMARMLRETLELEGYSVTLAADGVEGAACLKGGSFDLVLTDLRLPQKDGLHVLKTAKTAVPLRPVIVMTAYGSVETAVNAMKLGAFDFITKPLDTDYLLILIERALQNRKLVTENILLRDSLQHETGKSRIIGSSPGMLDVADKIRKAAPTRATVLLLGESGTGKELFARAIHDLSTRRDNAFVAINCAAIPGDLLESELFGHEKGAFTGAGDRKLGKLELAHMGTVFLDEVGEMDISLQAKLLRALQEGEIDRVGGGTPVSVDLRIIAASNRDLESAVEAQEFREDLFYRLSAFPVLIPPLRDRKADIPLLVQHLIERFCTELNRPAISVSSDAMDMLTNYSWKGNVRELENVMERAIILSDGPLITPAELNIRQQGAGVDLWDSIPMAGSLDEAAKAALKIVESRRIRLALEQTGGNRTRAAEILSVSYKTLLARIKDYGISL